MFWKFIVFENFGENEITGFASLIMQKSHSKLAKFNTLALKQYGTLENEVDLSKSITHLLSTNGTYVNFCRTLEGLMALLKIDILRTSR